MEHTAKKITAFSGIVFISTCFFAGNINAQMNERPWGFNGQNRASIAALMQQVESADSAATVISTGTGSVTTLICGGDSADASATGNASCIILNNSDGSINLGQDASGDQDANSESTETTNVEETINVEEILATLSGEPASEESSAIETLFE